MTQKQPIITIFGGTGFIGRYVVQRLAKAGYRLRIITRNPDAALHLKMAGDPGQIMLVSGNLSRPESITGSMDGAFAVVNLVGVLFEAGAQRFNALHEQAAGNLAKMAASAGVRRFVQISALGVDKTSGSEYARTKLLGEKAVLAAFPGATILRPGVVFGAEDDFFNAFARMPALPLIGGGKTRFQPVYVDDVAKAVVAALETEDALGGIYELGGATVYSFRALMEYVRSLLGGHKWLINIPFWLAGVVALKCELAHKLLPFFIRKPLLTRDQLKLLKYDNVVSPGMKTFRELGITPQPLELIVPPYLARYHPRKEL